MCLQNFEGEYDQNALRLVTPRGCGFVMYVAPRYVKHYAECRYEEYSSKLIVELSGTAKVFVDVGAHVGYYSLLLGTAREDLKIVAIEPVSANYAVLQRNLELNKINRVQALCVAASDKNGRAVLRVAEASDSCSFHEHPLARCVAKEEVIEAKLDSLLEDLTDVPTFVKIDVEGHEIQVLRGMSQLCRRLSDIRLMVEFNPKLLRSAGHNPDELIEELSAQGFNVYALVEDEHKYYRVPRSDPSRAEAHVKNDSYLNLLCVKSEQALSVCIFSHSSELGGAERSLLQLVTELIRDHGHLCTVVLPSEGPLKYRLEAIGAATIVAGYHYWWCMTSREPGVNISSIMAKGALQLVDTVLPMLKQINPDVFLTNTIVIPWGALSAMMLGRPHVWFVREFGDKDHGLDFYFPLQDVRKFIRDYSNIVLTNSNAIRESLDEDSSDTVIKTVYMDIEMPSLPSSIGYLRYFKISSAAKLLILGAIIPGKGQEDAIIAVAELMVRGHDVELLVMGYWSNPEYFEKLQSIVSEKELHARVRFEEFRDDPYPVMDEADIVLVCSHKEAFGRVALEAMLLGKPVVASNVGGLPEIVRDGCTGFLYESGNPEDLADKVEALIRDPEQRALFGRKGLEIATECFTAAGYGGKVAQTLRELKNEVNPLVGNWLELLGLPDAVLQKVQQLADKEQVAQTLVDKVVARDAQLISLNQDIVERDGQIVALNTSVKEQKGRVGSLEEIVREKDGQINSLNQDIVERDGQITSLNQGIADRDGQITAILSSRSWQITAPLRAIGFKLRLMRNRVAIAKAICGVTRTNGLRDGYRLFKGRRLLLISGTFDANYYLRQNPDVAAARIDPALHYLVHGAVEGRNPNTHFDTSWYLRQNLDVAKSGVNPLVHYIKFGAGEGRDPSSLFSSSAYLAANLDVAAAGMNPLLHYLKFGMAEGRQSIPIKQLYTGVQQNIGIRSDNHEVRLRTRATITSATVDEQVEVIREFGLFDEAYYRTMYIDLQPAPRDVIRHYCEYGWREGRNPSDDFDTQFYLETYSDIRNAGINPFYHYVVAGASECRQALPDLSTRHENDIWFGVVDSDIKLVAFYALPAWAAVRSGRPMFRGHSQPLLPHDELGFYGMSDGRALRHQAQMAKSHGIYGFCFRFCIDADGAANQPVESILDHDDIDFHFCLHVELSSQDILEPFIEVLVRAVSDRRYIRIENRPVALVALPGRGEQAANLLDRLRCRLAEMGIGTSFMIIQRESTSDDSLYSTLVNLCDAALDLYITTVPSETGDDILPLDKNGIEVVPYSVVASQGVKRAQNVRNSDCPLYHVVTLGRDNTARRPEHPFVYTRFHVRDYRRWLDAAITSVRFAYPEDRRFVFVNGWNDWNEGLFLEPDRQGGFSRLNETTRALLGIAQGTVMPKVSVIVPNYNHEPFLRRRLDSIYRQTYKNIEVILLDDYSSDNSCAVLDEYAAAFPEITHKQYNDKNSGSPFRQWGKGIKASSGDLVWIAESDDFCDESFLEVLVRCFDDEAVLLAYSKCIFVDRDEVPMQDELKFHLNDLKCAEKWNASYVETAHNEVRNALGIKNTIPNSSGVLFKRPIGMPLLDDESWLSMKVAGDWIFYLQLIRGGKIAYSVDSTNFFRRYEGSAAEVTYKKDIFYREVGRASQTVAELYDVPLAVLEQCRKNFKKLYDYHLGGNDKEFLLWYNYDSVLQARKGRKSNVMVCTMGFYPGGAEILPIRLANEFKRQGLSVLLLSADLNPREDGVRRMLRNDVPLIETSDVESLKAIIRDFGIEVLNTHQWHIQKYPLQVSDVFNELYAHIASLHGMIEHGNAFHVTEAELRKADQSVTTWVYTADKNLIPFSDAGLLDMASNRFVKIPNGLPLARFVSVPRANMDIPEDAFTLCCVSRAIPEKGWAETIQVVERARMLSGRDIRLILVGNGPVYDQYCGTGVPGFVYLAGFSDNSVGYYASADMGIMLTTFRSESFPLTIIDCLFAEKPYIASDVGEIRNMLTASGGIAGAVIELDDWEVPIESTAQTVAAFATNKHKYMNALQLVGEVVTRYKIENVATQYVGLFERDRKSVAERGCPGGFATTYVPGVTR